MEAKLLVFIVQSAINLARSIWEYADITHKGKIPSWEEILEKNIKLQQKIDAEK